MQRKYIIIALIIICILWSISFSNTVLLKEVKANIAVNKSVSQDIKKHIDVSDGPYVFWKGNRAIVQYICNNQKITRQFEVTDSVKIAKSCSDSSITFQLTANPPTPAPDTFVEVSKIFAISDIHGNYDQMIKLLKGNKIITNNLHWNWGEGHLVIVGDVFDRGAKMTNALWFIHQLEKEAKKNGGCVHLVLGNHEIMVLRGDLRYVNKKYTKVTARKLKIKVQDLYGPEAELGRWLRSKNVIIKINNILFVHGGISPELLKRNYTIHKVNKIFQKSIDVRDYTIQFDEDLKLLFGSNGPLWYRGYIIKNSDSLKVSKEQMESIITFYNVEAVVVGHTIVEKITSFYEGRVFAIETGIQKGSAGEALVWEQGVFYRSDVHGTREVLR